MVFRLILVSTLLLFIQINGISQIELDGNGPSFKEIFSLGIQTQYSIMPSYQNGYFSSEYPFVNPTTSRFFEIGLVSNLRLSKRWDFNVSTEYRRLESFEQSGNYNYSPFPGPSGQLQRIGGLNHWNQTYNSNSVSITWGLSHEIFKFYKFDITLHAAYGVNYMLNTSLDNEYLITEFIHQDMENEFQSETDIRSPNYSISENFKTLEAGIGIKFHKFCYEILTSVSGENLAGRNFHYGGRIRYLFLYL